MAKLKESFVFAGMQRDLSVSKHPTQFLYDAKNIRITARDGDTMLSITNERGPKRINRKDSEEYLTITGEYIAHCLLNQYLAVLVYGESSTGSTSMVNKMFRIDLKNLTSRTLFEYDFGTTPEDHVDMIASYENEGVQKIYWTDGKNQPKVINIADPRIEERDQHSERWYPFTSEYMFDFVPALSLNETVGVKKVLGSGGEFAPGVIQYAFTYYYKYGQESNIFYTTPLLYISYGDRGASPEDKVDNVFEITVKNLDMKFDYLRIYSIQRTSINATPFCKRVQDIAITEDLDWVDEDDHSKGKKASFIDTGTTGDNVDPTELLYKGGETIAAKTLEQKDNTLFLGNLEIIRKQITDKELDGVLTDIENHFKNPNNLTAAIVRQFEPNVVTSSDYKYSNQLTSYSTTGDKISVPCSGYKKGNYYRLGLQFQYKSGKWSDPVWIKDLEEKERFSENNNRINVPGFKGTLPNSITRKLAGYKKVRPLVVFPTMQDRDVLCQGVVNPTMTTPENNFYQSSWFFRPTLNSNYNYLNSDGVTASPVGSFYTGPITYTNKNVGIDSEHPGWDPIKTTAQYSENIRLTEVQGEYNLSNKFMLSQGYLTFHSSDVEFDEQFKTMDFANLKCSCIGYASFDKTFSDIEIQTKTPTISSGGTGFVKKSFSKEYSYGIVSGLFYDDFFVDEDSPSPENIRSYSKQYAAAKWLVYPWQGNGSLNNDILRPADFGVQSAELKKKIISNLRYATTKFTGDTNSCNLKDVELFSSNEVSMVKVNGEIYQGNIDTLLNPDESDGDYFAYEGFKYASFLDIEGYYHTNISTPFNSNVWWKTWSDNANASANQGIRKWGTSSHYWEYWNWISASKTDIGDGFVDLVMKTRPVRMKYKSAAHLILCPDYSYSRWETQNYPSSLPILEILRRVPTADSTRFGGKSIDALKANIWIPAGEPVPFSAMGDTTIKWEYGDTYFQRYDCLKTYAFTPEDPNQVVEIGSFMLETHVNIDGRYDRNRGQINNLNMSPQNFNLINPVYSQTDNFFSYRILDDDYYKNNEFPNQFTWTKEKQSGADVDLWTNITLASTYDIDGSKGAIKSLNFWKDTIYCFQDKGISRILFNSRVQIPASDGVPIEISNNYKVDGYQYLSDGIGCKNIHLIKETPSGIYFIDSVAGHLFQLGEGLSDITEKCNMTTWFKKEGPGITRVLYDDIHHDVYLPYDNGDWALCFSEKVGQFTGFYSYGVYPMMESYNHRIFTLYPYSYETPQQGTFHSQELHTLFEGDYNTFFKYGNSKKIVFKPSELTFICNGSSNNVVGADKIFTNLEFRASVEGDGELNGETGKFTPTLPLNTIEVWDEYQHGIATLENKSGHSFFEHFMDDGTASLKRKFRIWRCDIPRDNVPINPTTEAPMGIYRKGAVGTRPHRNDRMRNPWLFIKLIKDAPEEGNPRVELHDLQVTYFA